MHTRDQVATTLGSALHAGIWMCRTCFAAQLFSTALGVSCSEEQEDEGQSGSDDEEQAFLRSHFGHALEPLKKKKDRYFADRPVWDPLRVAYEEVTDGRETYLLKSWRTDVNEPRRYALLRGTLEVSTTVQLPEEPLRSELARAFPRVSQQADFIVRQLQHVVATLPPEELAPVYWSADDSQVLFSYLSERHLRQCVAACQTEGERLDTAEVRNFFAKHQQDEALTLEIHHSYRPRFS